MMKERECEELLEVAQELAREKGSQGGDQYSHHASLNRSINSWGAASPLRCSLDSRLY